MTGTQSSISRTTSAEVVSNWYQLYADRGIRYAESMLRSRADAEEVVQDAFCRLLKFLTNKPISSESRFRATFFTIIRNLSIDLLRRRKLRPQVSLNQIAEPAVKRPHQESRETETAICAAIDRLPKNWSEALRLKVQATLSYEEIADLLGCSKAQVRTWIYRARRQMETELRGLGIIESN